MKLRKMVLSLPAVLLLFSPIMSFGQDNRTDPPFLRYLHHPWVDSVMKSLSLEEKIAQLIWVAAFSDHDIAHDVYLSNLIRNSGVGGVIFFGGEAEKQTKMINYFQQISKVPLMVAADGEWSPGMRLNGIVSFPYQMTLGAIRNDSLIYEMGKIVAGQFKRAGIHINFVPVADVGNNPANPAINFRSFGENPENTATKTLMYMKGMQDNGIIADSRALAAGTDLPEYVADAELTINTVVDKIRTGQIRESDINEKCMKVLAAKYWAGLNENKEISVEGIETDLSSPHVVALVRELYANALTLLKNDDDLIPVREIRDKKIATIAVNRKEMTVFQQRLGKYYPAEHYFVNPEDTASTNQILRILDKYDLVIAGVYGLAQEPAMGFGIRPGLNTFLEKLTSAGNLIVTWFGNPYALEKIPAIQNAGGLVLAYQENEFTEDLSAQLIFGGIGAGGALPVTINDQWPCGFGITTSWNIRHRYGVPENAGLSSVKLERKIDSIVGAGLAARAFPGCEVMIARKGIVVFQKTYGYHTYENRITVQEDDLYDLASLTKISSTLAGLMLLHSQGKFSPDETLGSYLPYFKNSNKGDIKMSEFLTHQAGLPAWMPFWKSTVNRKGDFKKRVFEPGYSKRYPLEVAEGLYINKNYRKKVFREIKKSPLGEKKYLYSDLTFIIAPEIIENITGQKWYDFVTENIYHKIGAYDVGFNPYLKYNLSRIVPTEYDSLFRKQLLHGTVHDEGAAILGGISGHAGLFATANDLMKLMELYRRMGEYGGEQIISREVMEKYTKVQFPENDNRRGLGFDKPLLNNSEVPEKNAYPSKSASPSSFGHSGFTGTFVWVDPEYDISYVFLCNRVYPTRENNKLSEMNIRTEILQSIYDSITGR